MRVIGIDPGMVRSGYGIVERTGSRLTAIDFGTIALGTGPMEGRLKRLFEMLSSVVSAHRPGEAAIEGVFAAKNARSALILGHARGVTLLVASMNGLPVFEYAPAEVKRAVTSSGRAEKSQVQKMVSMLLGLSKVPPADAADALAIAICHCQTARPQLQWRQS